MATDYHFDWQELARTERSGYTMSFTNWFLPTVLGPSKWDAAVDEIDTRSEHFTDVVVTMQLNGVSVDPKNVFDAIEQGLDNMVTREANRLVREDEHLQRLRDAADMLYDAAQELRTEMRKRLRDLGIDITLGEDD